MGNWPVPIEVLKELEKYFPRSEIKAAYYEYQSIMDAPANKRNRPHPSPCCIELMRFNSLHYFGEVMKPYEPNE